jgi:hypothetical protein
MRKIYTLVMACACFASIILFSCNQKINHQPALISTIDGDNEGYDGPAERDLLEIEKTKDPALGYVPTEKLLAALNETEFRKTSYEARTLGINWIERGPIFDSVGISNGNLRGTTRNAPGTYTSGRMRAVLVDPTDPTGNTVFAAGVGGGVWKTTNLLDAIPTWQNVNDFFDNMAISSICMDPSNSNIMYFSTGEPTSNIDAILGLGLWKSTDHGATWNILTNTLSFTRTFKLLCDNTGNVYAALRGGGIRRSSDQGVSWVDISPTGYSTISVSDIEISSTGTLHVSLGYYTSAGVATHRYSTSPSTVTASTWSSSTGLPSSANRLEMATAGDVVWICPTSTANNVFGAYKSIDGGATFTQQHSATYTTSLSNTQGWYNISLDVNQDVPSQFIVGGLDAYRSINDGATVSRISNWASLNPFVHADHHYVKWWTVGAETRILIATDGGLFLSRDNGLTFIDKNRNLGLKQFYSCAIHPSLPDYFLGGAQDNGSHQLNAPGLTYSFEVTGGDGAYVDIDQNEPQFQFTSYVYNQYRRSINGGANWTSFNFSNASGLFINPFDYDDVNNKMFASYGGTMFRWNNPTTATSTADASSDILTILGATGSLTAFTTSPNVNKRLYVGTSTGKLFRIENSDAVTSLDIDANTTNITGAGFAGYLNCVAVGSTDQNLLAIFTNYGVTNIWQTSNGGTSWAGIDGNLPNMPVRWAVYDPTDNNKIIIATEAGVYITRNVNGASTQWIPSADFPTVRTDMLKVRASDKLILAATHGRGLWSSITTTVLPVKNINLQARLNANGNSILNWQSIGSINSTKFNIQYSINGISFTDIATVGNTVSNFSHLLSAPIGYYRIMSVEQNAGAVYSNVAMVKSSKPISGLRLNISPNPVSSFANFILNSREAGFYKWIIFDMQGRLIQNGNGTLQSGGSISLPVNISKLARGSYYLQVIQSQQKTQSAFIKL